MYKKPDKNFIKLPQTNVYVWGTKYDINGNKCLIYSFGQNNRKKSVQTSAYDKLRNLDINAKMKANEILERNSIEKIKDALIDYIKNWASTKQKEELYIEE